MFGNFGSAFDTLLRLQEAFESAQTADYFGYNTTCRGVYPSINLFQQGDDTVLTAEIPGLKKSDIKLEIKEDMIRIAGRRSIKFPENASIHRVERGDLDFDRTLKLPAHVDTAKVKAEYNDGILRVLLPGTDQDKPRQISIG
jgi:HSP20 family protein